MATVIELLAAHPAICADCLAQQTGQRSDVVFDELDRLGIVPLEGRCAWCAEVTPVFSAR